MLIEREASVNFAALPSDLEGMSLETLYASSTHSHFLSRYLIMTTGHSGTPNFKADQQVRLSRTAVSWYIKHFAFSASCCVRFLNQFARVISSRRTLLSQFLKPVFAAHNDIGETCPVAMTVIKRQLPKQSPTDAETLLPDRYLQRDLLLSPSVLSRPKRNAQAHHEKLKKAFFPFDLQNLQIAVDTLPKTTLLDDTSCALRLPLLLYQTSAASNQIKDQTRALRRRELDLIADDMEEILGLGTFDKNPKRRRPGEGNWDSPTIDEPVILVIGTDAGVSGTKRSHTAHGALVMNHFTSRMSSQKRPLLSAGCSEPHSSKSCPKWQCRSENPDSST